MMTTPATAEDTWAPECPRTLRCKVVPAAYVANDGNVADYGNYDKLNRPHDGVSINQVVIHDTEGSLEDTLDHFRDPRTYVSAHYVIAPDGTVYQMVRTKDMTWHAGNWSVNMHAVSIEMVGKAADSSSFTPRAYRSVAKLTRYLTARFNIPRDRAHITAHDNVSATSMAGILTQHVDPGPFWNWEKFLRRVGAHVPKSGAVGSLVTVAPSWRHNKQVVTGCSPGTTSCVPDKLQATNFVYLRTEPRDDAPLFTDPTLGAGSTAISNNAARLFYGQTFAVADRRVEAKGEWFQVWVNGAKGWFYSPRNAPTAMPATGKYVTPKASEPVATYARAIPERSEYPADLLATPPASTYLPAPTPLPYKMLPGQRYAVLDTQVPTDHFYAWASDSSFPYDHTLFKGANRYLMVSLGNRIAYVEADKVMMGG